MFAAFPTAVELSGFRCLSNPPGYAPARILRLRHDRDRCPPLLANAPARLRLASHCSSASAVNGGNGISLGQRLPRGALPEGLPDASFLHAVLRTTESATGSKRLNTFTEEWPLDTQSQRFLTAIERGEVLVLYRILVGRFQLDKSRPDRVTLHPWPGDLEKLIRLLPQNTFSELLRLLDPGNVRSVIEMLGEGGEQLRISRGMARMTPFGRLVDDTGVRKVFTGLFARLWRLCELRRSAGLPLLLHDYPVLLRSAGSTASMHRVKMVWDDYLREKDHLKRPDIVAELIRARFLTEPAYHQFNLQTIRVWPIHLGNSGFKMSPRRYRRLHKISVSMFERQTDGFGLHNPPVQSHLYGMKPVVCQWHTLSRVLSSGRPPLKLLRNIQEKSSRWDEETLCALMMALSRTGNLRLCHRLLATWGVRVESSPRQEHSVSVQYSGDALRKTFPRQSGLLLAPTERLLMAVAQIYCSVGEVLLALRVIDQLSMLYRIPVSDELWLHLFQWTYVYCDPIVQRQWSILGRPVKDMDSKSVLNFWDLMTSAPNEVRPGLAHYHMMAKSCISLGRYKQTLGLMEEMLAEHETRVRDSEDAAASLAYARAVGLHTLLPWEKHRTAKNREWESWFYLQDCCRELLAGIKSRFKDSSRHISATLIPDFVRRFERFMPHQIRYWTATGFVELNMDTTGRRMWHHRAKLVKRPSRFRDKFDKDHPSPWLCEPFDRSIKRLKPFTKARFAVIRRFPVSKDYDSVPLTRGGMAKTAWMQREFG